MPDIIDAQEALRIGSVNRVLPAENFMLHVRELADQIANGPPVSFRWMKENINLASTSAPCSNVKPSPTYVVAKPKIIGRLSRHSWENGMHPSSDVSADVDHGSLALHFTKS